MATNYYRAQLDAGQEYQDHVAARLLSEGIVLVNYQSRRAQSEHGENALGLEIKYDMKFATTNNFWIETEERFDVFGLYVPSGIFRTDNSWLYGLGNYEEFFIFSKRSLQHHAKSVRVVENERRTSRGFLLSRRAAVELAERMFHWPSRGSEMGK